MGDVMYQVLHRRRISTMAGASLVLEHNLRSNIFQESVDIETVEVPDYLDADSMKYNTYEGCLSREAFCLEYQKKVDDAKLARKIQRNASRIIETVISSSHSFCEDWKTNPDSYETMKKYLDDAIAWEKARHGDVVLSITTHWDETTVHAHMLSIPLVPYFDKTTHESRMKFSASEFFGNRKDLIEMHTDFHEQVGKKYGLERGQSGSRATHKELRDYKSWEQEQREQLEEKEDALSERERQNDEREKSNDETAQALVEREQIVQKQASKVDRDAQVLKVKLKEFETVIAKSNQSIPVIPEPPISLSRNKLKVWVDSVQENVTKAFRGIKAAYESLVSKYNKAVAEIHQLRSANKQLYEENVQIRHELLNKPIAEIQAHRDAVRERMRDREKQEQDRGPEKHGHAR